MSHWRWRQYVLPIFWYPPTSPHGVTTHKNNIDILAAMRTSSLIPLIILYFIWPFICICLYFYGLCGGGGSWMSEKYKRNIRFAIYRNKALAFWLLMHHTNNKASNWIESEAHYELGSKVARALRRWAMSNKIHYVKLFKDNSWSCTLMFGANKQIREYWLLTVFTAHCTLH
jgi:hypothetical protein